MFNDIKIKDIASFLQKKNKSNEDLIYLKELLEPFEFMEKLLSNIPNEFCSQFLKEMSHKRVIEKEVITSFGNVKIL